MRWSLDLAVHNLVASPRPDRVETDALEAIATALELGPDGAGHRARVWVFLEKDQLEVVCIGAARPGRTKPAYPEFYFRDHLVVMLNPGHDHAERRMYSVDDTGQVRGEAQLIFPGEEPGDAPSLQRPGPPAAQGEFRTLGAERYFARLRIPARDLWAAPGVAGFAVKAGFHDEIVFDALAWPPFPSWSRDLPFAFGDLHREPLALRVERLEIPEPFWGGDASTIVLSGTLGKGAPLSGEVSGKVRAATALPPEPGAVDTSALWDANGRAFRATVPVVFPHRGKWANPLEKAARLRLALEDSGGRTLWQGEFVFGFDMGIIVRERYGPQGQSLPARPAPTDSAFVNRFRAYVLARLPDYRLRTTAAGAPSDFYLEDREGQAHLDLAKPGALDRAADMLAARFPAWQDALCAAALWTYHPHITRHSSAWAKIAGQASLESVLRIGGCFCSDTAVIGAYLAEALGARLGVKLKGYSMGLRGHLCTLVESPAGRVVIDPMHGLFYHTLDNTRLATLEELRAQREISHRMWAFPGVDQHEFFLENALQIIRPWHDRPLIWPHAQE
ncbi:MAG: hypothetical protein HY291_08105 [Planctomycetes bacterium]|nr:hypothetical protein [Planctomycetota bacterium]